MTRTHPGLRSVALAMPALLAVSALASVVDGATAVLTPYLSADRGRSDG